MRKEAIIPTLTIVIILSMALTFAAPTEIHVRTLPNHKVSIFVLKPNQAYSLLESYHLNSGSSGEVSVVYSGTENTIKIMVKITKDNQKVMLETFEDFNAGEPIYLQVKPGEIYRDYRELDSQLAANETETIETENETIETVEGQLPAEETEISEENANINKTSITGATIFNKVKGTFTSKIFFYIIIAIIIAAVVIFIIRKMPLIKTEKPTYLDFSKKREQKQLLDAEKKIKEAQAEINKIKNQDKIEEAEKKFQQAKDELDKLKRGE